VYFDSLDKARRLQAALLDLRPGIRTLEVQAQVDVIGVAAAELPVPWSDMIVARRGDYVAAEYAESPNADDAVSSSSARSRPASVVEASDSLGKFQAVDSLSRTFPKYGEPSVPAPAHCTPGMCASGRHAYSGRACTRVNAL
jgi:hypothetical protein